MPKKENYMQMGIGAEIGIYADQDSKKDEEKNTFQQFLCNNRHYSVAVESLWPSVTMTLYVKDGGKETVAYTRPKQEHWWLDGFNPGIAFHKQNTIRLTATIAFTSDNIAKAFMKATVETDSASRVSRRRSGKDVTID